MPIRMVQDDPNQNQDDFNGNENSDNSSNQSSGGGLGNFLFLLPFIGGIFKRPKLLLLLVGLIAAYYFLIRPMMNGSNGSGDVQHTGANFDEKRYKETEVFEPLDNSAVNNNALPERVSLEKFCPTRQNQGEQGSCVAWSSAYAARTIMESAATGKDPNALVFSPAFLYNNIKANGECQGALLPDAMNFMLRYGSIPYNYFPYNPNNCSRQAPNETFQMASSFKTRGYQRLTRSDYDQRPDFDAIKQNLAAGAPVVFGMMVPRSFMQDMVGEKVWQPEPGDNPNYGTMGGHAMCLIGYDDNLAGGSFQIMNSWGQQWGENGIGWVRYKDFMTFTKEAYGLYPLVAKGDATNKQFACKIGLVENSKKQFIPLRIKSPNVFETSMPIPKGTRFKMYVNNELECYTYIFGMETNNSSYVLFPYTAKHSAFCGITGVRLFPRTESLMADQVGNKDYMAIVVTKQPIDYVALNKKINASAGVDYATKVKNALGSMNITNVQFSALENVINFKTTAPSENKAVLAVVEVNKN